MSDSAGTAPRFVEIRHTLAIRSLVSYTAPRSAFVTNVLIVSAYADFRDIYTLGLRHEGLWAEAIEGRDEAEAVLRRMRLDAITLHLGHDESGWTDCAFLLKMAQPAPVILLTGWVHPDVPEQAPERMPRPVVDAPDRKRN